MPSSENQEPSVAPPAGDPTPSAIADGQERRLDPRSITVDRLRGAIVCAFWVLFVVIGLVVLTVTGPLSLRGPLGPLGPLISATSFLLLCGAAAALTWFWPPVAYRHTSYRLSEQGLRIRRGVVWRVAIAVPSSRVQHTDVAQGPVERAFDLATLVVYTAGTQHASVALNGLQHERALAIRDYLIDRDDDDAL